MNAVRIRTPHKYRAKPVTVDGVWFASTKEATRWAELQLLEKVGQIRALTRQVKFPICVAPYPAVAHDPSELVDCGSFIADFQYYDCRAQQEVTEDAKGLRTPLYRLKKKLVEALYGITIREC